MQLPELLVDILFRGPAGNGLDPAYTGGDGAFMADGKEAQFTGRSHVRTAAKLDGKRRIDDNHTDLVAIFLTEEGHGAELKGFLLLHFLYDNGYVLADLFIDETVNGVDLFVRHFCKVRKVEAQLLFVDEGSFLCDMCPQYFP